MRGYQCFFPSQSGFNVFLFAIWIAASAEKKPRPCTIDYVYIQINSLEIFNS